MNEWNIKMKMKFFSPSSEIFCIENNFANLCFESEWIWLSVCMSQAPSLWIIVAQNWKHESWWNRFFLEKLNEKLGKLFWWNFSLSFFIRLHFPFLPFENFFNIRLSNKNKPEEDNSHCLLAAHDFPLPSSPNYRARISHEFMKSLLFRFALEFTF